VSAAATDRSARFGAGLLVGFRSSVLTVVGRGFGVSATGGFDSGGLTGSGRAGSISGGGTGAGSATATSGGGSGKASI
ncbi:hypothetical protein J8J27_35365, partial [Mycobacterium tuberculosis]|nr:hypothetical protein [Mycobacterium tuberculosis]